MSGREILVATDFSEPAAAALPVARALAERFGARLHLLHVLWSGEVGVTELLRRMADDLKAAGPVVVATATGDAADAIVQYARRHHADIVVVGTHGRTGVSRVLLGSVAERVIRHAPCPVVVVPATLPLPVTPAGEEPVSGAAARCVVCAKPSPDLVCEGCRAHIRGEALEHKQREERAGRV